MLPDIPSGWQTVLAAAGAILVVIAILKWTGAILTGHGHISELLINRSYDLLDKQSEPGTSLTVIDAGPDDAGSLIGGPLGSTAEQRSQTSPPSPEEATPDE